MDNLNERGLIELKPTEKTKIDGGLLMYPTHYPGKGLVTVIVKSIEGAYQSGYDNAQENC
ncbi:hypothetical protein [Fodinibius sp. Rm-B-1B1-1]|uniref:hypothetical protein n=1 Tax=Fodinibius alkaliphilus TaxID=3140241 RepID=UPI003159D892